VGSELFPADICAPGKGVPSFLSVIIPVMVDWAFSLPVNHTNPENIIAAYIPCRMHALIFVFMMFIFPTPALSGSGYWGIISALVFRHPLWRSISAKIKKKQIREVEK